MKLKKYLDFLNKEVENNPELLEMELVYAMDDEGIDFRTIDHAPTIGVFKNGVFEDLDSTHSKEQLNALCIN